MARELRRPAELLDQIGSVLRGQRLETNGGGSFDVPEHLRNRIVGDCDEHATLAAVGPAAVGIETVLGLGGHWERPEGSPGPKLFLHHVWGGAILEGGPRRVAGNLPCWDLDTTIKHFKLGQYAPFPQYATQFIFRDNPS